MTPDQFARLPDAFRKIVELDRRFRRDAVVFLSDIRERRALRRLAEITCRQPAPAGALA